MAVRLAAKLDALEEHHREEIAKQGGIKGLLNNVRSAAIRGDLNEVLHLLMVWTCKN